MKSQSILDKPDLQNSTVYCNKCILPKTFPSTEINTDGVCNYCNSYKTKCNYKGLNAFYDVFSRAKGRNTSYDCIVPISGGKDSTYILYYVKKELQLNPIAVNYNSGFQMDMASENIRKTCEKLNVPLILKKGRFSKQLLKKNLQIGSVRGEDSSGGFQKGALRSCGNCESMLRSMAIKTAKKYKIGVVLWGTHSIEDETSSRLMELLYRQWGKNKKKKKSISKRFQSLKFKLKNVMYKKNQTTYIRLFSWNLPIRYFYLAVLYQFWNVMQKLFCGLPLRYVFESRSQIAFIDQNPKFIMLYDYIDFFHYEGGGSSLESNIAVLKKELDWQCPDKKESRFDCDIHWLGNYFFTQKNHISMDGAKFCNQIREGHLTRDEALIRETVLQADLITRCNHILQYLGLKNVFLRELLPNEERSQNECFVLKKKNNPRELTK